MEIPNIEDIESSYEVRDLDKHTISRFDEILNHQIAEEESEELFEDETINLILKHAEKWEKIPREVYIIDFWNPPQFMEDYLEEASRNVMDYPGLEGVKFSDNLLKAGFEMSRGIRRYMIEVDNRLDSNRRYNPNMIGSPSEIYEFVPIPEQYRADDIFTDRGEGKRLGILEDDYTVIAQQGLKTAEWMDSKPGRDISYQFIDTMKENIQAFIPEDKVRASERS